ncbi:MAG: AAA family ATPase [Promethearchaeia archaeon]
MYIKEITGSNIFSYKEFNIKLNKFNVLIGPNASGKSNFIEILDFLKDILKVGLEDAINIHGDIKFIRNINLGPKKNLSLKVKIECEKSFKPLIISEVINENDNNRNFFGFSICNFIYELEIEFEKKPNKWRIFEEKLFVSVDLYDVDKNSIKNDEIHFKKISKDKVGNVQIKITKIKDNLSIDYDTPEKLPEKYRYFLNYSTFRTIPGDEEVNPELESILEKKILYPILIPVIKFIENISISKINKDKIIKSEHSKSKKRILESDASNLKWIIDRIISDKKKKEKFIRLIRDILPFIDNFYTKKPKKDSLELNFSEIYNSRELLPSFLLSDGTIDITVFIILLFFEREKKLLIFEEPISHIHPQLISKVINMMKEITEDSEKQIILTTHNPEILKFCKIEDIISVSRDKKGFSEIYRPRDNKEIETFLKNKLGIQDLFIENLL